MHVDFARPVRPFLFAILAAAVRVARRRSDTGRAPRRPRHADGGWAIRTTPRRSKLVRVGDARPERDQRWVQLAIPAGHHDPGHTVQSSRLQRRIDADQIDGEANAATGSTKAQRTGTTSQISCTNRSAASGPHRAVRRPWGTTWSPADINGATFGASTTTAHHTAVDCGYRSRGIPGTTSPMR